MGKKYIKLNDPTLQGSEYAVKEEIIVKTCTISLKTNFVTMNLNS